MSTKRPPLGVRLTVDVEEIRAPRGTVWWARVRWHDPESGPRETIKRSHPTREAADAWIAHMQNASRTGVDSTQTLAEYVTFIGDRWTRGIDPTSTYDPYSAGLRLRVVPTLGHLPLGQREPLRIPFVVLRDLPVAATNNPYVCGGSTDLGQGRVDHGAGRDV